ncbi:MAG: L-threonylcarbamoyladenylate synthase [Patescibacteria group bacterium]
MNQSVARVLSIGGIAVIPTDTLYGVVARAHDKEAAARLFTLRRATTPKPFIILIDDISRLPEFGVRITPAEQTFLKKIWPGKVSVILPCWTKRFSYLHLGTNTLAFRLPKSKKLQKLLAETGPLLAPSANPEGQQPAKTITEAKKYFGNTVDAYFSAGRMSGEPSTLVSLLSGKPVVLREGAVQIPTT